MGMRKQTIEETAQWLEKAANELRKQSRISEVDGAIIIVCDDNGKSLVVKGGCYYHLTQAMIETLYRISEEAKEAGIELPIEVGVIDVDPLAVDGRIETNH